MVFSIPWPWRKWALRPLLWRLPSLLLWPPPLWLHLPPLPPPVVGGEEINAPMPGNILDVKVATGASVKKGDVLVILEAMKMENEIMAPSDGKITSVGVAKGAAVDTGAVLCTIA